ncbi:hypothetical protein GCM10023325_07380 [Sphingomonas lutea]
MFSMEGMAMSVRYLLMGAMALGLTAPVSAQPAQPQGGQERQPENRPAEVVLASAERVAVPAVQQTGDTPQAATAPKKRAARVTSCRCAGQTADASR